jgi:hypothetical protein
MPSAGKISLSNLMLNRECLTQARSALGRVGRERWFIDSDDPSAERSRRGGTLQRERITARRLPKELQKL